MKRVLRKLGNDLRSRRGAVIGAGMATAALAIVIGTPPATVLVSALVSVALVGVALLASSRRISAQQRRANRMDQRLRQVERAAERLDARMAAQERRPSTINQIVGGPADPVLDTEDVIRRISAARSALRGRTRPLPSSLADDTWNYDRPLVSVVVPCYNEERFVAETIESIKRQSYDNWECIVVDDASTDDSLLRIWRAVSADERFRVVRHRKNGGLSAARNTGLRLANGRYITFIDGDDLLLEDSLLGRLEALADWAHDPAVVGTYCGIRLVPETVELGSLLPREDWSPPPFHDFVSSDGECPFNAHAPLLRTDVIRRAGGFDEAMLHGGEDWDLWLRLMRGGYVFRPAPHVGAVYRQKSASMARRLAAEHVAVSTRLIASAFQEAEPLPATTDGAMLEPLQFYRLRLTVAKRTIQYAAMALLESDHAGAEETLARLEPGTWDFLARHLDIGGIATDGFRRSLGIGPREAVSLAHDLGPLRAEMIALVEEQTRGREPAPAPTPAPTFDVAFVPETAHQAEEMVAVGLRIGGAVAFIDPERENGLQGVGAVLAEHHVTGWSINQWVLQRVQTSALIVPRPRGAATEILARSVEEQGGTVIEMSTDLDTILVLEDAHFTDGTRPILAADDLPAAIAAAPGETEVHAPSSWPIDPSPEEGWIVEEYPATRFDAADLERFRDIHRGERVVIIGNGPSLNDLDLTKLADTPTIAVNGIFYASDKMGFDPTYYVVEDTAVMDDNLEAIKAYRAGHKFFPSIYRSKVGDHPNVSYFMMNRGFYAPASPSYCVPRFSTDIGQRVYCGQSVTIINLQLAYHMGFSEVVLIGMDFSYVIPEDAERTGDVLTSQGDDPNHFHPDYFGKGKKWKDPKLDRVLANYGLAKLMFETDGRRIVNATAGGRLELFERVNYGDLF